MSTDLDLIDDLAADVRAESHRTVTKPEMPWIRERAARRRRRRVLAQALATAGLVAGLGAGGAWAQAKYDQEEVVVVATDGAQGQLDRNAGDGDAPVTTSSPACDRLRVTEGLDIGFVVTDEQEITRLEELSGRYSGQPGARAVVTTTDGRVKLIVDDEVDPELVAEAEREGLEVVTSCVTAADLRAVQSALATVTVEGDDYVTSGYSVFTDMASMFTSLPEDRIRAALVQAGIAAERIDSVVAIDIGQPGQVGRLIGNDGTGGS